MLVNEVVTAGDFDPEDFYSFWYRSPGDHPSSHGDPYRSEDAKEALGMKISPDKAGGMEPPAVTGKVGVAARGSSTDSEPEPGGEKPHESDEDKEAV